jgi:hypothetical protein
MPRWYTTGWDLTSPPVGQRCTLGRLARPTEHSAVADVERRTAGRERHDVVGGWVDGRVRFAPEARAPVAVLAAMPGDHPGAEALPGARAVEGVVAAAARLAGMVGAATAMPAGDHAADRAELHRSRPLPASRSTNAAAVAPLTLVTLACRALVIVKSVAEAVAAVYPSRVLHLGDQTMGGAPDDPFPKGDNDRRRPATGLGRVKDQRSTTSDKQG